LHNQILCGKNRQAFDFLKQTNATKYYYAKDMPVSPRRHIGVAQFTTTAYPT
jgi:hypothetical protein